MKISRARDLQTPLQRGSSRQAFTWVPRGWREGRCQRKHRRGLTARGIGGNKRELPPPARRGGELWVPQACLYRAAWPWDTSSGLMLFI